MVVIAMLITSFAPCVATIGLTINIYANNKVIHVEYLQLNIQCYQNFVILTTNTFSHFYFGLSEDTLSQNISGDVLGLRSNTHPGVLLPFVTTFVVPSNILILALSIV